MSKGVLDAGETATMRGGTALDSAQLNFAPRSSRMTLDAYANEVVEQLQVRDGPAAEFVLVHPQRSQESAEIWSALETLVKACKA